MRKNSKNETDLPLTISSKDGLVDQISYFNKTVASKDMSGYYLLKNGEFAYNKSYSVGYDFGSIKRLDRYPMGALSTLYICFALTQHDSDFMKVYFDSLKWYKEIYMIAAEGARNHGLLNVPTDDFFNTQHILPADTKEQQKIAAFLLLLEKRIEKQRQLVEALKSYKRGVLRHIFSGIDCSVPLYQISEYFSSSNTMAIIDSNETGEYPVYDAGGIITHIDRYDFDKPYVAIIKDGSGIGRLQLCQSHSSIIGTLGALFPVNCTVYFLYAVLQIIDFRQFTTGMAIPHIYYKDYRNIAVPYPDEKTRHTIENMASRLDEILYRESTMLCRLQKQKLGLLQRLFI